MAKIDYKKLRNELAKRTNRYAEGVRVLYDQALADIAKQFADVDYDPNDVFSFEGVGKFDKVDAIMRRLESQIEDVVKKGIVTEFGNAYRGCNELIKQVCGERVSGEIEKAFAPRGTSGNAAKSFIRANRVGNITASQRVWNGAVLGQMETAVEECLMDGQGARRMATLLEEYLTDPDSCFRRFRIKTGVDANGKSMYGRKWKKRITHMDGSTTWKDADPRDYPSGRGVYHSSYKNALRYARTTTNIAYRTADYDRYQEFAFVVGIEIHISNNPHHIQDICDDLAGRYPKDFKWTGWHPNCMCYQVPVLAKKSEVDDMVDEILDGGDANSVSVGNAIADVPDNFKEWVIKNEKRMEQAVSMPYFIRDNTSYVSNILGDTNLAQSLVKKYGLTGAKYFRSPIDGKFVIDITGGIATAAMTGISALINAFYNVQANSERVEILQQIISHNGFERMNYHSTKDHSIYAMGMKMFDKKLREGEMPANIAIARKMLADGYDVYLLPNPNSMVSADFIMKKGNKVYYFEGKTLNGKSSLDHRLMSAAKQSDRVVINIIGTDDARYIASEVKFAFERNKGLNEVVLLKGKRVISLKRNTILDKQFDKFFMKTWNRNK